VNRIARTDAERTEVFAETTARKGLAEAIVEKDFWVCSVLTQLFSIRALGRTAPVSKAAHRFREAQSGRHEMLFTEYSLYGILAYGMGS
jgi:hypothetical protein